MSDDAEVDFFGAHIKVRSARLAALLNSAVTDDVVIVGKRARDLVSPDEREDEMNVALGGIEARGDAGTLPRRATPTPTARSTARATRPRRSRRSRHPRHDARACPRRPTGPRAEDVSCVAP